VSPRLRSRSRSEAPRVALRALSWERIQVILCLRPTGTGPIDPAGLRLRFDRDPAVLAEPIRAWTDGDDVLVRFNVMHGPDQMPYRAGRWTLVLEDPGEPAPIPLVVDTSGVPLRPEQAARFPLTDGDFTATPVMGRAATLALDVSLDPADPHAPRWAGGLSDENLGPPAVPRRRRLARRVVQAVRLKLFALTHRAFGLAARRNGRRILFTSDSRAELGGNLKVVHDRMVERGLDREYQLMTLFKPSIAERRRFLDRARLPWMLARADVIFLDDYQPVIYHLDDPAVRIVQLWHASGAFKTVGYSRVGKPGGPNPYTRAHKNYTYAIVSSDFDVPFYAEAFGIREERVIPTGIPRMDRFFDEQQRATARAEALEAFPQARDRFTILFAPTFRGATRTASYDAARIDVAALHALAVERDAVVIFKMHPFVREVLAIPPELSDRLVDATATSIDVNELLSAVDLLVTDYSSIVFEFSIFDRPMLFFAYDLEEYIAERDFYVPFEEFVPGRIVQTFDELLDAIRREDYQADKVAAFARRHFDHLDGGSTDRVIDLALAR
jgi:CDP-glycerol glycerophosphotransferase (TagB/SpsB family)